MEHFDFNLCDLIHSPRRRLPCLGGEAASSAHPLPTTGENPDGGTKVTLNATANTDISRVELSIELSSGLSLVKGDQAWEGPIKKGETQQVEFVVQSRGSSPQRVTGKAIIHLDAGGEMIERSTLNLNGAPKDSTSHSPAIKRKQEGESIHEYKGE